MTVRLSNRPRDPYLGYDAERAARLAAACLQCLPPAPCTLACPRGGDLPRLVRLVGQAACEGLALPRWFQDEEQVESDRICDAIADAYN